MQSETLQSNSCMWSLIELSRIDRVQDLGPVLNLQITPTCSIVAIQEKKYFSIKYLVFYYYVGQSLAMTRKGNK